MLIAENRKSLYFKFALIFLIVLPGTACQGQNSPDNLQVVSIHFEKSDGRKSEQITTEVTRSSATRQKGLMYRRELEQARGMIFVFPGEDRDIQMWMKNTYIPLDMIFVNSSLKVVGILRDIPILNLKPRTVESKAKYLLEIKAGEAERLGIERGDLLRWGNEIEDAVD